MCNFFAVVTLTCAAMHVATRPDLGYSFLCPVFSMHTTFHHFHNRLLTLSQLNTKPWLHKINYNYRFSSRSCDAIHYALSGLDSLKTSPGMVGHLSFFFWHIADKCKMWHGRREWGPWEGRFLSW